MQSEGKTRLHLRDRRRACPALHNSRPNSVALSGVIDLRTQAEVVRARRSDTPPQVSWKAIQAQEAIGE
jgi:hypothetical protein